MKSRHEDDRVGATVLDGEADLANSKGGRRRLDRRVPDGHQRLGRFGLGVDAAEGAGMRLKLGERKLARLGQVEPERLPLAWLDPGKHLHDLRDQIDHPRPFEALEVHLPGHAEAVEEVVGREGVTVVKA